VAQDTSSKIKVGVMTRRYIKSSSFVMALVFTILCGAAACSIGYFIHYFAKGHFIEATEAVLDSEIRYVEAIGAGEDLPRNTGRLYVYLNPNGELPDYLSSSIARLAEGIIVFTYPQNSERYAAKIHTFENRQKILIGTDITSLSKKFDFMRWLGIASICFVMVVVFVAFVISIFVVSETNKIANTAREIMETGDLSQRLEVGSRWDDLGNMGAVLNALFSRIEELMQGVRQVSDNIAHDLRTPLSRMRGSIEALEDGEEKDELLLEADQLLSTFNALLRISRIEAEKQRSQFQDVDLEQLMSDIVEFYEPLAEEKGVLLNVELKQAQVFGDRDLLFQAFANILDNAVKFTPEKGVVKVCISDQSAGIGVEISDSGPGVAPEERKKVFKRFYRAAQCRSTKGTGLGLSLVHAVVDLHGGEILVEDNEPGLRIITIL